MIHLIFKEGLSEDLEQKIATLWKGASVMTRELLQNQLSQIEAATRPHSATRIKLVQAYQKKWRVVLKQLLQNRHVYKG